MADGRQEFDSLHQLVALRRNQHNVFINVDASKLQMSKWDLEGRGECAVSNNHNRRPQLTIEYKVHITHHRNSHYVMHLDAKESSF